MLTRLLIVAALVGASWQDPAPDRKEGQEAKEPKRGDNVTVRGCLTGSVLDSSQMAVPGSDSRIFQPVTFRLTGDKKTMEQIRKEHSGHLDTIVGVLKTDLPTTMNRGKRIGNTNVTVGIGASRGMQPEPPPPMPVLQVKSIEHSDQRCR